MFHPTSLAPVEAIMTMIRATKIDHGTNQECSLLGIHIRYMTNDSNFRALHRYFWVFNETYDHFFSSCSCYMLAFYFGIQDGFRPFGLNWCMVWLF